METSEQKITADGSLKVRNVRLIQDWIRMRDLSGDWNDYVRTNKLNRAEIARECGFGKSALQQNSTVKSILEALEARLTSQGVLIDPGQHSTSAEHPQEPPQGKQADKDAQVALNMAVRAKAVAQQRVKAVEEQNALLRAEIKELKDKLRKSSMLDEHLGRTGRLLTP